MYIILWEVYAVAKFVVKKVALALVTILVMSFFLFTFIEATPPPIFDGLPVFPIFGCVDLGCTLHTAYNDGWGVNADTCIRMRVDNLSFGERARLFMFHGFAWRQYARMEASIEAFSAVWIDAGIHR